MNLIKVDDWIVDEDTGVIIEAPAGRNSSYQAVQRLHNAREQKKLWDQEAALFQKVVMHDVTEKSASFQDFLVTRVQGATQEVDWEGFKDWLVSQELPVHVLWDILMVATGFDREKLPHTFRERVAGEFTHTKPSAPYVRVTKVKERHGGLERHKYSGD